MLILELKSCLLKIKKSKCFVLQLVEDGYHALLFLKRKVLYPPLVILLSSVVHLLSCKQINMFPSVNCYVNDNSYVRYGNT